MIAETLLKLLRVKLTRDRSLVIFLILRDVSDDQSRSLFLINQLCLI